MTSITAAHTPHTRLRLTQRGRRVVAAVIAVPLAAALGWTALSGGSALASHDHGVPASEFITVSVAPGESLWSIARDVAPLSDPRDVVADIRRLNALESSTLHAGMQLAIPAQYADEAASAAS